MIIDVDNVPWDLHGDDYILEVDYDKGIGLTMRLHSDTGQQLHYNIIVEDTADNHKIINAQMLKQNKMVYDNGWVEPD